jgi:D-3-phosphoglycerate dehydrogenase
MAPRVLIADKLSSAAAQIFKDRGIETDVKTGLERDALIKIIGDYDGIAVRSATKVTEKVIAAANGLKVIGRAGIGVDNIDVPAATSKGIIVMNTPFGNSITTAEHAIALFARARATDPASRYLDPGREVGKEPLHGCRAHREDARHHWLRQYRFDRGRSRAWPPYARDRL